MPIFPLSSRPLLVRLVARIAAPALALLFPLPAAAQGDLLVAPTRVVLSGGGATEVVLSNIGTAPATYRISVELRRMTANGDLVEVSDADATAAEKAAQEMVRYAPRRIVLAPSQPQSVRISARPDPALPDGEYRVHLLFRAVPDEAAADAPAPVAVAGPKNVVIKLVPIYGITIPVIIRKGSLEASAALANPHLIVDNGHPSLKLDMTRQGTRSVFGEIRVLPLGSDEPVMVARGIAIYPEITQRSVVLPLSAEQAAKLKSGRFHIVYNELPENGGATIATLDSAIN